jgi:hypothetical protein
MARILRTPENSEGEWISISEYAALMNISTTRVHQKINAGQIYSLSVHDIYTRYPEVYRKIGRGQSGMCSILVFLADDDGV